MSELGQLEADAQRLRVINDELLDAAEKLEADLAESNKENYVLVQKLGAAENEVQRLREAAGAPKPVDTQILALKEHNHRLARQNEELRKDIAVLNSHFDKISEREQAVDDDLAYVDEIERDIGKREAVMSTREAQLNRVTDYTLERFREAQRMRQEAERLKRTRSDYVTREMQLRLQNGALEKKIEDLEAELESRTPVSSPATSRKVTAGGL